MITGNVLQNIKQQITETGFFTLDDSSKSVISDEEYAENEKFIKEFERKYSQGQTK